MRRLALLPALGLLASCSLAPPYARPESPVPRSWPAGDAYLADTEAALPTLPYREIFRDPRLQRLIGQALAANRDLRIAAANIAAARAQYRVQRAERLPAIDANANIAHSGRGAGTATPAGDAAGAGMPGDSYSTSLGITAFEIDLFGRVRSLTDAAQARYFETEAAARATRLTLVGDIATAWLTQASDRSLLQIARETATSAAQSAKLTRARLAEGIAPRTDVDQADLVLHTSQFDLAQQTTALAQDLNALQLLVGVPIDPALLADSIEEAGKTVGDAPAGLDSAILLRRPDVVQSEFELRATNAEIGAARAQLFPRISLTATLGFASTALGELFSGGAYHYAVATGASVPIFDGGAGRANVALSEARRDAALATYEQTIQVAFSEVADALARRGTIDAQLTAQQDLTAAAADNAQLADARYRAGIDSFLLSLDAQRSLYSARKSLNATRLARAANRVTLYRTIGGDASLQPVADGASASP